MNSESHQCAPPVERLAYSKKEAGAALGLSPVSLWRLEKAGLLMPIPYLRHKRYSIETLKKFVAGK
jgi:hypothetical protein